MSDSFHRVVMFTDVRGSTSLYETLGDAVAEKTIRRSREICEGQIRNADGTVIKALGDGLLATFPSAMTALAAARAIQTLHQGMNVRLGIGLHAGEVIEKEGDVYGDVVNVAARLCALARADEILTSSMVAEAVPPAHGIDLQPMAAFQVKGKLSPISVFRVGWGTNPEETMFFQAGRADSRHSLTVRTAAETFVIDHDRPVLTIGRIVGDIVLPDKMVSREHATIRLAAGRFVLMDQSTNGTFIHYANGQEVMVRREAVDIVGYGVIGFGNPPSVPETRVGFQYR